MLGLLGDDASALGPRKLESKLNFGLSYNPSNRYEKSPEYTGYVGVTAKWSGNPLKNKPDFDIHAGVKGRLEGVLDWDAKWEARSKHNKIHQDGKHPFWEEIKYFKREDFLCKGSGECGGQDLIDRKLVRLLDHIRKATGKPMTVNSACRCEDYNKKVGGAKKSAHVPIEKISYAADIRCRDSRTRFLFIKFATELGINRIGVAKTFLHLDTSPHLSEQVVWFY